MIGPYQRVLRHKVLPFKCDKLTLYTMSEFEYFCKQFTSNFKSNLPPATKYVRLNDFLKFDATFYQYCK